MTILLEAGSTIHWFTLSHLERKNKNSFKSRIDLISVFRYFDVKWMFCSSSYLLKKNQRFENIKENIKPKNRVKVVP